MWGELQRLAQDREEWRLLIDGLFPDGATDNDDDNDDHECTD